MDHSLLRVLDRSIRCQRPQSLMLRALVFLTVYCVWVVLGCVGCIELALSTMAVPQKFGSATGEHGIYARNVAYAKLKCFTVFQSAVIPEQ